MRALIRSFAQGVSTMLYDVFAPPLIPIRERRLIQEGLGEYEDRGGVRFYPQQMGRVQSVKWRQRINDN